MPLQVPIKCDMQNFEFYHFFCFCDTVQVLFAQGDPTFFWSPIYLLFLWRRKRKKVKKGLKQNHNVGLHHQLLVSLYFDNNVDSPFCLFLSWMKHAWINHALGKYLTVIKNWKTKPINCLRFLRYNGALSATRLKLLCKTKTLNWSLTSYKT